MSVTVVLTVTVTVVVTVSVVLTVTVLVAGEMLVEVVVMGQPSWRRGSPPAGRP